MMDSSNITVGKFGEDLACQYLVKQGHRVLGRNFRRPWGEIDIITRERGGTLVFVEVKTMWENKKIAPEENLTVAKLKKFKKAAMLFAGSKQGQGLIDDKKGWRLDLIAITLKNLTEKQNDYEIKHFENVA